MIIKNGTVFCEDGTFRQMDIETRQQAIAAMGEQLPGTGQHVIDAANCYVMPGFVDIHIHGAMGADFSDGDAAATRTIAEYLLGKGVTSFLATSLALSEQRLTSIYQTLKPEINKQLPGRAVMRGINMEGPFFSKEKRGAQNEKFIIDADYSLFTRLNAASGDQIRTVALAPEMPGALDFIQQAAGQCNVSLAHSTAGYETAMAAFGKGANHVTHLFNGMAPFSHRDTGIVGAAADSDAYVEVICDGSHLQPSMVRAIFKLFSKERVCLISDAMRACGMPAGQYDLGGKLVTVQNGLATIDGGSLAGSITNVADGFRKAVEFGIPLEKAAKAATLNPARSVGLDDQVGSLAAGKRADILLLGKDLTLKQVISGGRLQPV